MKKDKRIITLTLFLITVALLSLTSCDPMYNPPINVNDKLIGQWESEKGDMKWTVTHRIMEVVICDQKEQLNYHLSFPWELTLVDEDYYLHVYERQYLITFFSPEIPYDLFSNLSIHNFHLIECRPNDNIADVRCQEEWTLTRQ